MILSYQLTKADPASTIQTFAIRNDPRSNAVDASDAWVVSDVRLVLPSGVGDWLLTLGVNLEGELITSPAVRLASSATATVAPLPRTPAGTLEWTRVIPNPGLPLAQDACDWSAGHALRLDLQNAAADWSGTLIQITVRRHIPE